jgi:hypothetical protein
LIQTIVNFTRLSLPHLVLIHHPQTEVEVVCTVQSDFEVDIRWIVFAEADADDAGDAAGKGNKFELLGNFC